MDGWQTIATFALAAVPGILVLEILQLGRPRLRERSGLRGAAYYLIISAVVWALCIVLLGADGHLAAVIDSGRKGDGSAQVSAYIALAWLLAVIAVGLGLGCRVTLALAQRVAFELERRRQAGAVAAGGILGDALIQSVSISYAWDALMQRLRRRAKAQVVRVRLKDGSTVFGVLAAGGFADFQADGRGLLLDVELIEERGKLTEIPGSSGVFVVPDSVATVAFLDFPEVEDGGKVEP